MSSFSIPRLPYNPNENQRSLVERIQNIFSDLEDQLNQRTPLYLNTTGIIPEGILPQEVLFVAFEGKIEIKVKVDKKSFLTLDIGMLQGLSSRGTNFLGRIVGTVAVSLINFPNDNEWGFYERTGVDFRLCYNMGGVLKTVVLA